MAGRVRPSCTRRDPSRTEPEEETQDSLGNTPLDDAIRHRRADVRRLLQKFGAEMGEAQARKRTRMMMNLMQT